MVHHWGCRLASPHVHLPVQRLALGSPLHCLHEKTRLARGHGSLNLGTYEAQASCTPLERYRMAYLCRLHGRLYRCALCIYLPTTHHRILRVSLHVHIGVSRGPQTRLTLVSVTTKHKSLHWACNRHLPMVGLPAVTGQAGKTEPGDFIIFIRVYSLATVEWKESLPGSSLSHLGLRSRNNDLSFLFLVLVLWQLL